MSDPLDNSFEAGPLDTRDLIPAHALGATDSAEVAAVLQLAESDPEAAAELGTYRALAEALLFAVEPQAPPPVLAGRLRAALQEQPVDVPPREAWQVRLARWFAPPTWPAWGVAALAVVLLVVSSVAWGQSMRQLRQEAARVAAMQEEQAALMRLMSSDSLQTTMVPATTQGDASEAWAELRWDPAHDMALLTVGGFPVLGDNQVYQLWFVRGEERASGGLFRVNDNGWARLMVQSPEPLERFDAVGVTPEPVGGSPGPTAPPVVRGPLQG
jgi:anti-sigma-K factor RskA